MNEQRTIIITIIIITIIIITIIIITITITKGKKADITTNTTLYCDGLALVVSLAVSLESHVLLESHLGARL